jgi:hypothetical protein
MTEDSVARNLCCIYHGVFNELVMNCRGQLIWNIYSTDQPMKCVCINCEGNHCGVSGIVTAARSKRLCAI